MEMKREEKRQQIREEFDKLIQDYLDFQGSYYVNPEDFDNGDIDTIIEKLTDGIQDNSEVIYYSTAMEYLSEEDPSLTRSLDIAKDFGYSLETLNSETLATLLKFEDMNSELRGIKEDIQQLLDKRQEI